MLQILKISILFFNSGKIEDFQPQILYFWKKIFQKKISDRLKFREGAIALFLCPPLPFTATMPHDYAIVVVMINSTVVISVYRRTSGAAGGHGIQRRVQCLR